MNESDPVIDAVREARHRISASVQHDPYRLVEHYIELQERHRDRLVSTVPDERQNADDAPVTQNREIVMAKEDPPIDEIRAARHRISAEHGHDPRRLVEYYRKIQERYKDRLIDAPPQEPTQVDEIA